jgi:hypothetical protein
MLTAPFIADSIHRLLPTAKTQTGKPRYKSTVNFLEASSVDQCEQSRCDGGLGLAQGTPFRR